MAAWVLVIEGHGPAESGDYPGDIERLVARWRSEAIAAGQRLGRVELRHAGSLLVLPGEES